MPATSSSKPASEKNHFKIGRDSSTKILESDTVSARNLGERKGATARKVYRLDYPISPRRAKSTEKRSVKKKSKKTNKINKLQTQYPSNNGYWLYFAARQAHHHPIALFDHIEMIDRIAHIVAQPFGEFIEIILLLFVSFGLPRLLSVSGNQSIGHEMRTGLGKSPVIGD
jgi:hypothetical protein